MPSGDIYWFEDTDDNLDDFGRNRLDQCGHHGTTRDFCSQCYTAILCRGVPKFSSQNSNFSGESHLSKVVEECLRLRNVYFHTFLIIPI